jgi:hypothetical protein
MKAIEMKARASQGAADFKSSLYSHGQQIKVSYCTRKSSNETALKLSSYAVPVPLAKIFYEQNDPHMSQRGKSAKKWFHAKISSINPDGTYNIRHIAGNARQSLNVPIQRIQKANICDKVAISWYVRTILQLPRDTLAAAYDSLNVQTHSVTSAHMQWKTVARPCRISLHSDVLRFNSEPRSAKGST